MTGVLSKFTCNMLTTEMSDAQYAQWRNDWCKRYKEDLVRECGENEEDAKVLAELMFEDFIGQGGDEARNEKISYERMIDVEKTND